VNLIQRCANCGLQKQKVLSVLAGKPLWFCSMSCKKKYLERTSEGKKEASALPTVQVFVAHKTRKGISIVRSKGEV